MWASLIAGLVLVGAIQSMPQELMDEEGQGRGILPDFSQCIRVPEICPNKNITFWLYTKSTQDNPFELTIDNVGSAPYQNGAPFVVLIHGYTGWRDYAPNPELRQAFFGLGDYNMISLDWGLIAKEPCYVQAAYNVKTVANCTTRLLLQMMDAMPQTINIDNLHIIGFSLGAQVAGNMGYYFKNLGNTTVKWMTALDPALPLFDSVLINKDSRISPDDAEFLDVYHTDAGNKGIVIPAGKVDFYLNNGYSQPGCGTNNSCDHYRAVLYYGESLNRDSIGFWGAPCKMVSAPGYFIGSNICGAAEGENTTTIMGFYTPHTTTGTYQVYTNSTPPFALGKNPETSKKKRFSVISSLFG